MPFAPKTISPIYKIWLLFKAVGLYHIVGTEFIPFDK
jgi:hypothetical protein